MIYPSRSSSCHAPFLPDIISPLVSTTSITVFLRINCLFSTSNRLDRRCLSLRLADLSIGNTSSYFTPLFSIYVSFARIRRRNVVSRASEMSFVYLIISSERKKLETKLQRRLASYRFNSLWYYLFDNLYFSPNTIR